MRGAAPAVVLLAAAFLLLALPADAAPLPDNNDNGGETTAVAAAALDGESLKLSDGRILRLAGIIAPARGHLAVDAKAALQGLAGGETLRLAFTGPPQDRRGRIVAQTYAGRLWLEAELVRRGLARVAGSADYRDGLDRLLAVEREARRYRRGLWADPAYAIVAAEEAGRRAGDFALVSGVVRSKSAASGGGLLLGFAEEPHRGLALVLSADALRLCRAAKRDPDALIGKSILVRGFIDGTRRPELVVTYPEQIEILRTKKKAAKQAPPP